MESLLLLYFLTNVHKQLLEFNLCRAWLSEHLQFYLIVKYN